MSRGHIWNFNSYTSPSGNKLTLSFSDVTSIAADKEIYLIDKSSNTSFNLRQRSTIDFVAKGSTVKSFQLIIGTIEFIAGLENADQIIPQKFSLHNNFPNPFNPETQITFSLGKTEKVKLAVYNVSGQQVALLENGVFEAGSYNVVWNALNQSSGVYFIRLVAGRKIKTIRAVLLK